MSKGKLLTGVLVGAAAGAVLGILMAPDKGSETRKKIAKKSNDVSGSVKDGFEKLGDTVSEKYRNIKDDAKEMIDKVKNKESALNQKYNTDNSF
ncbi:YtxH domain-containing protein [Ferruginibacter sp.]|uniref:YtxH domain-containing protein n=2 Tax=Ferruginibacter sp. TaxID=1940288 RepID=UPI00265A09C7|nr:YtxH domain-containing protein [Ferruginibacter sp.]